MLAVLIFVPPDRGRLACWAIVLAYAAGSALLGALLNPRHRGHLRWLWLAPFFDVAVLVALTSIAAQSAATTWTADLLERAFFLIPVLAATLLNPRMVAAIIVPTVAVYL